MNYLLDTHTFLWFINADPVLSSNAIGLIQAVENNIYLSSASIWEIAIKVSLGKLYVPSPIGMFLEEQLTENSIRLLNIKIEHATVIASLPFHHRDPFDRLIIAQALHEGMPIIGRDAAFDDYGIDRRW